MKKYNIIEISNQKIYKNVPFITKKDYKKISNSNIVGMTKLKKCESSSDNELDLLCYNNNQYKVKEKYYGLTVGYIYVGNNNYIVLKRRNLLLFLILLLAFIALLILLLFPKKEENVDIPQNYIKEEHLQEDSDIEITPPINEENEIIPPSDKPVEPDYKPQEILQYLVSFDGNGGTGSMEQITCVVGDKCRLPENQFSKDGHIFVGWSKDKSGEGIIIDSSEVDKLSDQDIVLYAIWEIQNFTITFLDYDNTEIETMTFEYGEQIKLPDNL